jgi:hypothetical protein
VKRTEGLPADQQRTNVNQDRAQDEAYHLHSYHNHLASINANIRHIPGKIAQQNSKQQQSSVVSPSRSLLKYLFI